MSLLTRPIASRLIGPAGLRTLQPASSIAKRSYAAPGTPSPSSEGKLKVSSQDAPTTPQGEAEMISKETPGESLARHNPDYNVEADYRTSMFSPIPKRVMDGSEPGETVAAAVLSGAPIDLQARTVRIYRPTKTATQSGTWHSHQWLIDWDPLQKGYRWENPLMGWQSSADAMQGTRLPFRSKEDAIRFAVKQGYEYFVQEPNERRILPKAYANNFLHSPKKLKHIRTK